MVTPRWVDTRSQPVAIDDVVRTLADAGERAEAPGEVQVGGAEVLTYREMMRRTAALFGRRPPLILKVPVLSPRLSSYWVALVTPVETGLVRPLVDGLKTEMVVEHAAARGAQRRAARLRRRRARGAQGDMTGLLNARRERRIADAVIRDPEEHTVMDERRRRALDPGRRRHRPGRRARGALERDPPRAPGAHVLEVPLARDARADPRHLHRHGAPRGAAVPAVRAAALRRPRVRGHARPRRRALAHHDGLLVSKRGRNGDGYLEIDVRRCPSEEEGRETVHVEVEVASFYPAIATWLTKFVYSHTQSRIHVLVTHGFLRSLARLDLEESAVGRFDPRGIRKEKDGSVTVGDTPWGDHRGARRGGGRLRRRARASGCGAQD